MLIHELGRRERDLVIQEAAVRTRYLWPEGADADLAHGVWSQLLKDLATTRHHYRAVEDWDDCAEPWWATGHGVNPIYLDELLRSWAFFGAGRDTEIPSIAPKSTKVTSKVCQTCNGDKPIEEYYHGRRKSGGRFTSCRSCREDGIGDKRQTTLRQSGTGYESEMEGYKVCRTCLKAKPKTAFHRHPNSPDGRMLHCAVCTCIRKGEARRKRARHGK